MTSFDTSNPSFDMSLLDILACPVSKAPLTYAADTQELMSAKAGLAYPIHNGIPILLKEEARELEG